MNTETKVLFGGFVATMIMLSNGAVAAIPEAQLNALKEIDQLFGVSESFPNEDWKSGITCLSSGITCDSAENVIGLELVPPQTNNIPESIGQLQHLESLTMLGSNVVGNLPDALYSLTGLKNIYFDGAQFHSPISSRVGELINLESIRFQASQIIGSLPKELSSLDKLKVLDFVANNLTGELPGEISKLTNLEYINLSQNLLTGNVPASWNALHKLEKVYLTANLLAGPLPKELVEGHAQRDQQTQWNLSFNSVYFSDTKADLQYVYNDLGKKVPAFYGVDFESQAWDAKITSAQYLGGDRVLLNWKAWDWASNGAVENSENPKSANIIYSIYSRVPGQDWNFVDQVYSGEVQNWEGEIWNLRDHSEIEFQVRELLNYDLFTFRYVESDGKQAEAFPLKIELSHNIAPSLLMYSQYGLMPEEATLEKGLHTLYFPGAVMYDDLDPKDQLVTSDLRYISNRTLLQEANFSVPSGTLSLGFRPNAVGDSLVAMAACDQDRDDASGVTRRCSESQVVIVGTQQTEKEALPSFKLTEHIVFPRSTDLVEIEGLAIDMLDNKGALNDSMSFQTVWLKGGDLFERKPWISYPSGTLRYQAKQGAEGTAVMYVSLQQNSELSSEAADKLGTTFPSSNVSRIATLHFRMRASRLSEKPKNTTTVDTAVTSSGSEESEKNVDSTGSDSSAESQLIVSGVSGEQDNQDPSDTSQVSTSGGGGAIFWPMLFLLCISSLRSKQHA